MFEWQKVKMSPAVISILLILMNYMVQVGLNQLVNLVKFLIYINIVLNVWCCDLLFDDDLIASYLNFI